MIFKNLIFAITLLESFSLKSAPIKKVDAKINSLSGLQEAIMDANEETITTIEIDSFTLSNTTLKDAMRNLNFNGKNIIIKGATEDTTITSIDQGSLYIVGQNGKTNNVTFEGITFAQEIDSSKTLSTPNNAVSLSKNSCNTNLTFRNCKFKNFTAIKNTGGAIQAAFSNAADYSFNLNVENCVFENCLSSLAGGAISADGSSNININIKNCLFDGNKSPHGGAILAKSSKISIYNSVFTNNSSDVGGAINLSNCWSFSSGNTFENNICSSSDGNSYHITNSKITGNSLINNCFFNNNSQYKEIFFDAIAGSLPEVDSKLFFNTFVSNCKNEIDYKNYFEHVKEIGNLYLSEYYDQNINIDNTCAYSSNFEIIKIDEFKRFLSNSDALLLEKESYEAPLKSFYNNVYGDFYIGNNTSNKVSINYNEKNFIFNNDDEIVLKADKFGFDLIENRVNDVLFESEKALLSSNSPIVVKAIHKLNIIGISLFIITPVLMVLLTFLIVLVCFKLKQKHSIAISNTNFDIHDLSTKIVKNKKCDVLTDKEKEVLVLILEGTPRKEISKQLYISESTVKNHVTKIYSKLDVKNRSELLKLFK